MRRCVKPIFCNTWGDEHPFAIYGGSPMRMDEFLISRWNSSFTISDGTSMQVGSCRLCALPSPLIRRQLAWKRLVVSQFLSKNEVLACQRTIADLMSKMIRKHQIWRCSSVRQSQVGEGYGPQVMAIEWRGEMMIPCGLGEPYFRTCCHIPSRDDGPNLAKKIR